MIIMQPIGGLCNRLRSLDSAIALAEKIGNPIHVIWICNSEFNCKFSNLFNVFEKIDALIEIKIRSRIIRFSLEQLADIYFSNGNNCCLKYIVDLSGNVGLLDRLCSANKIYIRTASQFYPPATPFLNFTPKSFLQEKIDSYKCKNMIGVHIRRSDNIKSTMHSPLHRFIACMKKEMDGNPGVKFFVATDDPQVEVHLRGIFKDRIVTHNKRSFDRNNPLAIQDAVIDLFSLANCQKLIGSYWSSFTDAAWQINQIDKIIIGPAKSTREVSLGN